MSTATSEQFVTTNIAETKSRGWFAVRLFVATVLLVAAGLKAHQLATTPSLGEGILESRWFNIFVVEFELLFGIWLIFGLLPKLTWLASVGLFTIFAGVSFFKAISGESSCGCFGEVTINPWLTACFDVGVVGMLWWVRPREIISDLSFEKMKEQCSMRDVVLCVGIYILAGGATYGWIAQMRYENLTEVGQVLHGNTVQLVPETWRGKKLPLLEYVVGANELTAGEKTVLLSRPGCADCETMKQQRLHDFVLEISRKNSLPQSNTYYLTHEISWIAETPIVIELSDGVVKNVRNRDELISSEKNIPFGNASADGRWGFQ